MLYNVETVQSIYGSSVVRRDLFLRKMCTYIHIIFMGVHYILYVGVEDILEFLPSDCDKNNLCPKPDQVYTTDFYLCIVNFFHRLTLLFAHNNMDFKVWVNFYRYEYICIYGI